MLLRKLIHIATLTAFVLTSVAGPSGLARASNGLDLPMPGVPLALSAPVSPVDLLGIKVFADNPLRFDFIVDKGKTSDQSDFKSTSTRLIKYFLTSLTVSEKDLWVNLSPYEKDRIIPDAFGRTEMGRDLLAEDYVLKQLSASLLHPDGESGKAFWKEVYAKLYEKFGTTDFPVDTFNKVWITPDHAKVYEKADRAFVVNARLKVMLESDYLAAEKAQSTGHMAQEESCVGARCPASGAQESQEFAKAALREVIIPIIERDVNEGANFAQLRQIYHALILSIWFKKRMKDSILGKNYVDQGKVSGVAMPGDEGQKDRQFIYQRYQEAFKTGVYNLIREENDPVTGDVIPRKYFSGGFAVSPKFALDDFESAQTLKPGEFSHQPAELAMVSVDCSQGKSESAMTVNAADYVYRPDDLFSAVSKALNAGEKVSMKVDDITYEIEEKLAETGPLVCRAWRKTDIRTTSVVLKFYRDLNIKDLNLDRDTFMQFFGVDAKRNAVVQTLFALPAGIDENIPGSKFTPYEYGFRNNHPFSLYHFIEMEFVDGKRLSEEKDKSEYLRVVARLVEDLAYVHQTFKVFHGDLLSKNIILDRFKRPVLIDWDTLSRSPKEDLGKDIKDVRWSMKYKDIFSIGDLLLATFQPEAKYVPNYLFSGRSRLKVLTDEELRKGRNTVITGLDSMDADPKLQGMAKIIRKAMLADPDENYESLDDLMVDLKIEFQKQGIAWPQGLLDAVKLGSQAVPGENEKAMQQKPADGSRKELLSRGSWMSRMPMGHFSEIFYELQLLFERDTRLEARLADDILRHEMSSLPAEVMSQGGWDALAPYKVARELVFQLGKVLSSLRIYKTATGKGLLEPENIKAVLDLGASPDGDVAAIPRAFPRAQVLGVESYPDSREQFRGPTRGWINLPSEKVKMIHSDIRDLSDSWHFAEATRGTQTFDLVVLQNRQLPMRSGDWKKALSFVAGKMSEKGKLVIMMDQLPQNRVGNLELQKAVGNPAPAFEETRVAYPGPVSVPVKVYVLEKQDVQEAVSEKAMKAKEEYLFNDKGQSFLDLLNDRTLASSDKRSLEDPLILIPGKDKTDDMKLRRLIDLIEYDDFSALHLEADQKAKLLELRELSNEKLEEKWARLSGRAFPKTFKELLGGMSNFDPANKRNWGYYIYELFTIYSYHTHMLPILQDDAKHARKRSKRHQEYLMLREDVSVRGSRFLLILEIFRRWIGPKAPVMPGIDTLAERTWEKWQDLQSQRKPAKALFRARPGARPVELTAQHPYPVEFTKGKKGSARLILKEKDGREELFTIRYEAANPETEDAGHYFIIIETDWTTFFIKVAKGSKATPLPGWGINVRFDKVDQKGKGTGEREDLVSLERTQEGAIFVLPAAAPVKQGPGISGASEKAMQTLDASDRQAVDRKNLFSVPGLGGVEVKERIDFTSVWNVEGIDGKYYLKVKKPDRIRKELLAFWLARRIGVNVPQIFKAGDDYKKVPAIVNYFNMQGGVGDTAAHLRADVNTMKAQDLNQPDSSGLEELLVHAQFSGDDDFYFEDSTNLKVKNLGGQDRYIRYDLDGGHGGNNSFAKFWPGKINELDPSRVARAVRRLYDIAPEEYRQASLESGIPADNIDIQKFEDRKKECVQEIMMGLAGMNQSPRASAILAAIRKELDVSEKAMNARTVLNLGLIATMLYFSPEIIKKVREYQKMIGMSPRTLVVNTVNTVIQSYEDAASVDILTLSNVPADPAARGENLRTLENHLALLEKVNAGPEIREQLKMLIAKYKESAMKVQDLGGIDLNPAKVNLDIDGDRAQISAGSGGTVNFENFDFDKLSPFIINIQPVTNMAELLGTTAH